MTTQHQIIALSVIAFISIPLGTFITIKTINKLTRPQVNTLTRTTGDIELLNYIDPVQPDQVYQPLDTLNPNYINYESYNWSDRVPSYYTGQYAPSYFSGGNPPSYYTNDRRFINCCLEDNINLDYIFYIILFCVFLLLIRKLIISNQLNTEKIIILLLLSIIYLQFGLFIIFNNSLYSISILIPFSLFEIDFRDSFDWEYNSWKDKHKISYLKIQTLTKDLIELLESLNDDIDYSFGLSFIASYKEWEKDKEKVHPLFINNAIIVNKESDPILITEFILKSLEDKKLFSTNWLFNDDKINTMDPVILTVTVAIRVII